MSLVGKTKILAIDPSTFTGLCQLNGDDAKTLVINHPDSRGYDRLQLIAISVMNTIEAWGSEVVIIENYAMNAKFNIVQMVEIGTIIRASLYRAGIEWWDVPPTVLKKFTTGNGAAKKGAMAVAVKERWGFTSKSDDVIDAYALARLAQHLAQSEENLIKGVTPWTSPAIKSRSSKPLASKMPKRACAR